MTVFVNRPYLLILILLPAFVQAEAREEAYSGLFPIELNAIPFNKPPPCNPFFPKPECNPLEEPSKAADSSLFTVKPPAGWKSDNGIAEATGADLAYWVPIVSKGRNHQAVILADAESTGLGTQEYMNDAVTMLSTMGQNGLTPGIAKLSEADTHLGGQLARETTFMFLIDDGVGYGNYYVLARYVVTTRDRIAYSLLYMAPEYAFREGLGDFNVSLQSFKILGYPAPRLEPIHLLVIAAFIASLSTYSFSYLRKRTLTREIASSPDNLTTYLFGVAIIVQTFHMIEHAAQVHQHAILGWTIPASSGILFFLDLEWNHMIFNALYFALLAILYFPFKFYDIKVSAGIRRFACLAFSAGFLVQGYHVVEHSVRMVQFFQFGCTPCRGILGYFFDGIYLHAFLNSVVYILPLIALIAYRFHSSTPTFKQGAQPKPAC